MDEQLPTPREASPEPTIPQSGEFARPCPHCIPGNRFGWQCPNPVPDPASDPEHAWTMDDGSPPGHACCGNWSAISSVPLGINSLNTHRGSPARICSQLTRLPRQSATCARSSSVVLACNTAASPSVFQVPTRTECQTLVTSFSPPRCTNASMATLLR